jgi:CTP synthase (UTP-ammonia lyase)
MELGFSRKLLLLAAKFVWMRKGKRKFRCFALSARSVFISAPDVETVYEVPLNFERDNLSRIILKKVGLKPKAPISKNGERWLKNKERE